MRLAVTIGLGIFVTGAAAAQERAAAVTPARDIVVVGKARPFRLKADALIAAMRTFDKGRSAFAPDAVLTFEARPTRRATAQGASMPPIALTLTNGVTAIPIALDTRGRFAMPVLPTGDWHVEANRGERALTIRPIVLSTGIAEPTRRLGDLRLECRTMWSMMKATAPMLGMPLVGMMDVLGPCSSKRVGIYIDTAMPVASATLHDGGRSTPVDVMKDGRAYRIPTAQKDYSNDATVAFLGM